MDTGGIGSAGGGDAAASRRSSHPHLDRRRRSRRALSKWFAVTVGVVLVYLFTCQHWPGMFNYKAFSLDRAIEILYLPNDEGIFGFLTGISADILYIYILFAAVLTTTGAGDFLIDFATWSAGWARGGSAKISVVSSALYGTVSGSTVANVYATGAFTIPMMKRSGYSAKQAAAVEAISGVGGQIMPPIMGAGSFIMAEVTGVPYFSIIKTAVIPAFLYYLGVMGMVHFIALRRGIESVTPAQRPRLRKMGRRSYFLLPFVFIVLLLASGYSPSKAAFHTIWITLLLSCCDRRTWLDGRKVLQIFFSSLVNCSLIAAVLAGAGMIVAVLTHRHRHGTLDDGLRRGVPGGRRRRLPLQPAQHGPADAAAGGSGAVGLRPADSHRPWSDGRRHGLRLVPARSGGAAKHHLGRMNRAPAEADPVPFAPWPPPGVRSAPGRWSWPPVPTRPGWPPCSGWTCPSDRGAASSWSPKHCPRPCATA
jgi:hypothetical protein